eukprot:g30925.t1
MRLGLELEHWNRSMRPASLTGVHDLSKLTHLHEPEVLHALQLRFDVDQIYTFCGPILIAVNPFKDIGDLYANAHDKKFKEPDMKDSEDRDDEARAEVLDLPAERYQAPGQQRCCRQDAITHHGNREEGARHELQVLNSNPVLEAFGNACTVRNNNSSRFGKFIELRFQIKGGASPAFSNAAIETYLLEKVRVTKIDKQELCDTSYHIFYQACAAHSSLDPADVEGAHRWSSWWEGTRGLDHVAEDFVYLRQSDRFELSSVDDSDEFLATRRSMEAMDISLPEQAEVLRIVAAVLHIGNIRIQEKANKVESQCRRTDQAVGEIMGIELPVLTRALTHKLIAVGSERYDSPLTLEQSEARRESLGRLIYSYLFNHLVFRINESLASSRAGGSSASSFIGVLDIFGFEHFKVNSFEQLCINFANERLQQMFNHFVFEELYKQEGISCDFTDFPDNQGIIDLIQAKSMSIFTLLDEECRMPKGSDKSLVQKLWKQFDKHENFRIEARKNMCFTVVHFAGPVSYDATSFMDWARRGAGPHDRKDKNMDELGELLRQAIEGSSNQFVRSLLERAVTENAKSPSEQKRQVGGRAKTLKPHTVAADFKGQLESLVTKMKQAGPHFVRCIKPNPEKLPDRIERQLVVEQLRSGGVIEALHDFLSLIFRSDERKRFGAMQLEACLKESLQQLSKELKWPASQPLYAIGKTTVFFKQVAYETIEGHPRMWVEDADLRNMELCDIVGNYWCQALFSKWISAYGALCACGMLGCALVDLRWRWPRKLSSSGVSRAGQLRGHGTVRLFGQNGGAAKVKQGALGDCWLVGAFACLADFPGHVEMLFDPMVLSPQGRYVIHLFDSKSGWRRVEIDDFIPCMSVPWIPQSLGGDMEFLVNYKDLPCFSQPVGGEVWPLLLEKAFAKVAGSYGALEGGIPEVAFQALTGQREQLRWQKESDGMWRLLRFEMPRFDNSKLTGDAQLDGLLEGHAYSVLEVQEVHGLRLIRLRNPWGKEEWTGRWSRRSNAWGDHPHVAADLALRGGRPADRGPADGSFWMPLEDFVNCFNSINICPSTMPVPKASRYGDATAKVAPICGRCARPVQSCWPLLGRKPI